MPRWSIQSAIPAFIGIALLGRCTTEARDRTSTHLCIRLARDRTQSNRSNLLVGVVPPLRLPAESDLERLFCEAYRRRHGRVLEHANDSSIASLRARP